MKKESVLALFFVVALSCIGCVKTNVTVENSPLLRIATLAEELCDGSDSLKLKRISNASVYCIYGEINSSVLAYFELEREKDYWESSIGSRILVLNSTGGDVRSSLAIVDLLRVGSYDIVIPDSSYCLSSCANYLFLGANKKVVSDHALIGWHGGIPTSKKQLAFMLNLNENEESNIEEIDFQWRAMANLVNENQRFLDSLGAKQSSLIYNLPKALDCVDIFDSSIGMQRLFWSPSLENLTTNYQIPGLYYKNSKYHNYDSVFFVRPDGYVKNWALEAGCSL